MKADSPLKTVKDVTASNTIAYSTSGSSSNNLVLAFADELGVKAKPTATGGPPGTLTQVMSGQIDIGWAAPPFGMKELKEGKIRILIRGSDVPPGGVHSDPGAQEIAGPRPAAPSLPGNKYK